MTSPDACQCCETPFLTRHPATFVLAGVYLCESCYKIIAKYQDIIQKRREDYANEGTR